LGSEPEVILKKFQDLGKLAEDLGFTQTQLSLAWVMRNQDVSVCLLGASKPSQIEENLKALQLYKKWTPEIEEKIEVTLFI
jgi:aryl-alcohol dehydrogenase-like predicted oxidoreductase